MSEPKVQVVLEADVKQFAAGMQSAMTSLERMVKAGLVVKMVKDALDFGKALEQIAAKSGTSTDWVQKFGYAAVQTGGSVEKLSAALFNLRRSISDAVGGSASDLTAFQALGVSMEDLKNGNTAGVFERIAKAVRESGAGIDQVNAATRVLGGNGDLIAGMAKGYDELTQEAERLGLVVDNQTIESINRLDKGLGTLGAKIKSVTAEFVGHIASLEKWSLTAQMASLIVMAPKRLIMSGFLGGGGLAGIVNAGGELYRMLAEANEIVDAYKVVAAGEATEPGSSGGGGNVKGLPSGSARRGRREETDALKRIGGYISGAGPTANLVNIQNQALQELRQIRSKLAEMARRDTSVNFTL